MIDTTAFWARVDRSGGPDACWPWRASKTRGYGHLSVGGGRLWYAHRVAYALEYGPIPRGEGYHGTCVCHSCDNRACCNPAHLWLGTNADNARDCGAKGRAHRPRGEANGNAKLADGDVVAIRCLRLVGREPTPALAARFGVSESQIQRVLKGVRL